MSRTVKRKLTYDSIKDKLDAHDLDSLRQEPAIQELVEQMYEERTGGKQSQLSIIQPVADSQPFINAVQNGQQVSANPHRTQPYMRQV